MPYRVHAVMEYAQDGDVIGFHQVIQHMAFIGKAEQSVKDILPPNTQLGIVGEKLALLFQAVDVGDGLTWSPLMQGVVDNLFEVVLGVFGESIISHLPVSVIYP